MFTLNDLKRALNKLGTPEIPRAERLTASGLAAVYGSDSPLSPASIKDISATGIYLVTERRLSTGEVITLKMLEEGKQEGSSESQISVQAKVTRQGEDGIGLSFVLPPGLDTDLWSVLIRNIALLSDRDQIEEMFRILRTILFLCQLCEAEAEESILLLGGEIAPERVETLVKIAFAAENLLASVPEAGRMRAHPKLVAKILREGSWTQDDLLIQLSAGLLVSSCWVDAPEDSNQVCAELLSHLGPEQAAIFVHACEWALGSAPGAENSTSGSIVISSKELMQLIGQANLARQAKDVTYLFTLGLIQKLPAVSSYRPIESFDITPTNLGIEFYKRCIGHRERLGQDLIETAKAHLLNVFLRPEPAVAGARALHWVRPPRGAKGK